LPGTKNAQHYQVKKRIKVGESDLWQKQILKINAGSIKTKTAVRKLSGLRFLFFENLRFLECTPTLIF